MTWSLTATNDIPANCYDTGLVPRWSTEDRLDLLQRHAQTDCLGILLRDCRRERPQQPAARAQRKQAGEQTEQQQTAAAASGHGGSSGMLTTDPHFGQVQWGAGRTRTHVNGSMQTVGTVLGLRCSLRS
jgi:hypothetical protein